MRRGPTSGHNLVMNVNIRAGQVNLIQTLAGDDVFHVPATRY